MTNEETIKGLRELLAQEQLVPHAAALVEAIERLSERTQFESLLEALKEARRVPPPDPYLYYSHPPPPYWVTSPYYPPYWSDPYQTWCKTTAP